MELKDVSLLDIAPDSITGDGQVSAAARAIDPQLRAMEIDAPAIYAGFDALPGAVLDHLAKQYDVTVWRDSWPDAVKRRVLRTSIADKRKKGTVQAVKNAVSSLGSAVTVREWWETGDTPHTFKIYVAQGDIDGHVSSDVQADLMSAIEDAKPVRSHYDFILQQPFAGTVNACAYLRCLTFARISSEGRVQADFASGLTIGAYARPMLMRRLTGEAFTEIVMPDVIFPAASGELAVSEAGSSVLFAEQTGELNYMYEIDGAGVPTGLISVD